MYFSARSARRRPEAAEATGAEHRDLCSTCNHAPACSNRGTPDSPMFFCEEFDAYVPVTVDAGSRPAPAGTAIRESQKHKGLCANCENRETCTMPRPEGGVWHCEEYR